MHYREVVHCTTQRRDAMAASTGLPYTGLPADDRMEIRVPRALKEHAERIAKSKGEKLSEYVIEVLAERVNVDLADRSWHLTVPEQAELLKILAAAAPPTPAFRDAE